MQGRRGSSKCIMGGRYGGLSVSRGPACCRVYVSIGVCWRLCATCDLGTSKGGIQVKTAAVTGLIVSSRYSVQTLHVWTLSVAVFHARVMIFLYSVR